MIRNEFHENDENRICYLRRYLKTVLFAAFYKLFAFHLFVILFIILQLFSLVLFFL